MAFCIKCGNELQEGSIFCHKCGCKQTISEEVGNAEYDFNQESHRLAAIATQYLNKGESKLAFETMEKAYSIAPDDPKINYSYLSFKAMEAAAIKAIAGSDVKTLEAYQRCIELVDFLKSKNYRPDDVRKTEIDISYTGGLVAISLDKKYEAALLFARTDYDLHPDAVYCISIFHLSEEEKYKNEILSDSEKLRKAVGSKNWPNASLRSDAYHTLSIYYCGICQEFGIVTDTALAYKCLEKAIELNPDNEAFKQEREKDYCIDQSGKVRYLPDENGYELDYSSAAPEKVGYKEFARRLQDVATRIKKYEYIEANLDKDRKLVNGVEKGIVKAHFWRDYAVFFAIGFVIMYSSFAIIPVIGAMFVGMMGAPEWIFIPIVIIGMLLGLTILIIGAIVASNKRKNRQAKLESDADEAQKRVAQMEYDSNHLFNDEFWLTYEQIPDAYQYPYAIYKFAEYFNNGRAESMKEAVNLFEEELHRMRIENAIELQNLELERQNIQNQLRNSYLLNISSKQTYYAYKD